jgi:hypothetical protein
MAGLREALCAALLLATPAAAAKPMPHYTVVDGGGAIDPDKVRTVPTWSRKFTIEDQRYGYRLVGQAPASATTSIPTVIVPIQLTVPDPTHLGPPIVFDATPIVPHIVASPLFSASLSGPDLQFSDAMLRAEFPDAPEGWHTLLAPEIGLTIDVTLPANTVVISRAANGNRFGFILDSTPIDRAISKFLHADPEPGRIAVFITYNSVESFAFGYHSWLWGDPSHGSALVYMYSSWLEGVDDVLGFPSPDAATLSHEITETVHDPLLTSVTLLWGDHFRHNRCFQSLIEVADAVEFAPLELVYAHEAGVVEGRPFLFTLQNAALLPWFERQTPSRATDGAYSFPSALPLHKAAPLTCVPKG